MRPSTKKNKRPIKATGIDSATPLHNTRPLAECCINRNKVRGRAIVIVCFKRASGRWPRLTQTSLCRTVLLCQPVIQSIGLKCFLTSRISGMHCRRHYLDFTDCLDSLNVSCTTITGRGLLRRSKRPASLTLAQHKTICFLCELYFASQPPFVS